MNILDELASATGGTIDEVGLLPDGSGFATMSMPLPKNHWLMAEGFNVPPMGLRVGTDNVDLHRELCQIITAATRYAYRSSSMNGKEEDIDPDALVQNMIVGLLGYHTNDGTSNLCGDPYDNPSPLPALVTSITRTA